MKLLKDYAGNEAVLFGEGGAKLTFLPEGVLVSNRQMAYSSLGIHAVALLGQKAAYKSTWHLTLPKGQEPIKLQIYHKVSEVYLDVPSTSYLFSDAVTVSSDAVTEVSLKTTIPSDTRLTDFIAYFIQQNGEKSDILVKDVTVEETEPDAVAAADRRERTLPPITRQKQRLIGTIRWDAFSKSEPDGKTPASQVARVLSPAAYHWQAPFFSEVDENGTVSFPEYTVETWEKEAAYAVAGGLDYFAYLWYETTDLMSEPRKYHLLSEKKDTIKMCGILETVRSEPTMNELFAAMKDSCYLRLDGRPVLFLYGFDRWTIEKIDKVKAMAKAAGEDDLYIVGMTTATNHFGFTNNLNKGLDAISWYSVGSTKTAETYEELKNCNEKCIRDMDKLCRAGGIELIPSFTAGRDTRARIQTGVSWVGGDPKAEKDADKPYRNWYALPPTDKELEDHIRFTLNWINDHPDTAKPNMVCSYGWNEHEEGGWLCPTLLCDEFGNVIRDENGQAIANHSRLDILKKVADETK